MRERIRKISGCDLQTQLQQEQMANCLTIACEGTGFARPSPQGFQGAVLLQADTQVDPTAPGKVRHQELTQEQQLHRAVDDALDFIEREQLDQAMTDSPENSQQQHQLSHAMMLASVHSQEQQLLSDAMMELPELSQEPPLDFQATAYAPEHPDEAMMGATVASEEGQVDDNRVGPQELSQEQQPVHTMMEAPEDPQTPEASTPNQAITESKSPCACAWSKCKTGVPELDIAILYECMAEIGKPLS